MTNRHFFSQRRAAHAGGQDITPPTTDVSVWLCRRSSDRHQRTYSDTDIRREDVLMELLDEAHARIRELEAALERCKRFAD
ncbi:MAG: hypothetical protein KIS79_11520 [Burkholderiales bacterium]|nr:hypothetical protein [Burkholderiales bacterium]